MDKRKETQQGDRLTSSDLKGSPINNRALYEKWNPMNHVAAWSTPQLVIHGGKDFRLIEGSGIGQYGVSSRPNLASLS